MKTRFPILLLTLAALGFVATCPATETKTRLLVLTDMGADPDDEQSLVRLLLYANQVDIEGIVATTLCWQQNKIRPAFGALHVRVELVNEPPLAAATERGCPMLSRPPAANASCEQFTLGFRGKNP